MNSDFWSTVPNNPRDFDEFWAIWPRKVKRIAAQKAYWKARETVSHATLIAGVNAYPFSPQAQYQPHAASWLNAGGYLIEEDTPPPTVIVNGDQKPTSVTTIRALGTLLDGSSQGVEQSDEGEDS